MHYTPLMHYTRDNEVFPDDYIFLCTALGIMMSFSDASNFLMYYTRDNNVILQRTESHLRCSSSENNFGRHASDPGWQRCMGCLKLKVVFRKSATNYRALLRKMSCKGRASYGSLQPCKVRLNCGLCKQH